MCNALGITEPLPVEVTPFWDRPYLVLHSGRFADATYALIESAEVRALAPGIGAVWQFGDCTDLLDSLAACRRATAVHDRLA